MRPKYRDEEFYIERLSVVLADWEASGGQFIDGKASDLMQAIWDLEDVATTLEAVEAIHSARVATGQASDRKRLQMIFI